MPFADEQIPQISELELGTSSTSIYSTWPAVFLDALRKAGTLGMNWSSLLESLGDSWTEGQPDHSAARNAIDYLVEVGLVRKVVLRWYVIPLHPRRKELSE